MEVPCCGGLEMGAKNALQASDPEGGIAPGTAFEDIPDDWVCPICGVGKDMFVKVD